MALSNRDKDVSEQKRSFLASIGNKANPVVTASTAMIGVVPFTSQLKALSISGYGTSGAPTVELRIHRFIPGAGATIIAPGVSSVVPSMGVSGPIGVSLPAPGSTLIQLLAGDGLFLLTGTANTSTDTLMVGITIQALQDFKADFGSST